MDWQIFEVSTSPRPVVAQGYGKVGSVLVNSMMILSGRRWWWRVARAMLVAPVRWSSPSAVFLTLAMIRGAWPVRTREASSANVVGP